MLHPNRDSSGGSWISDNVRSMEVRGMSFDANAHLKKSSLSQEI